MEKQQYKDKRIPREKKGFKESDPEKETKKEKCRQLIEAYGMNETTAMQIVADRISLEKWIAKKDEVKKREINREKFNKQASELADKESIPSRIAALILRGILTLEEYREKKLIKDEKEKEAKAMADKYGIALPVARMILKGKFTIEDYLERLKLREKRKEKALEIHQKHPNIALGTCYQIVDEGITIESFLKRKEENRRLRGTWFRNYLRDHKHENQPLSDYLDQLIFSKTAVTLFPYRLSPFQVFIIGYSPYVLKFKAQNNDMSSFPRIDLKYFLPSEYTSRLDYMIKYDENLKENPIHPHPRPSQRSKFPPGTPQKGQNLRLYIGEGEIIEGNVEWYSKFDINLIFSKEPYLNVIIFRHAVINVETI